MRLAVAAVVVLFALFARRYAQMLDPQVWNEEGIIVSQLVADGIMLEIAIGRRAAVFRTAATLALTAAAFRPMARCGTGMLVLSGATCRRIDRFRLVGPCWASKCAQRCRPVFTAVPHRSGRVDAERKEHGLTGHWRLRFAPRAVRRG